jgi:hypothetical protein
MSLFKKLAFHRVTWSSTLLLFSLLFLMGKVWAQTSDFIWIEGESPTTTISQAKIEGTSRGELVSDGKWLRIGLEPAEAEKITDAGLLIAYNFDLAKAGNHQLWNRIGFEASRTAFDWRVDDGAWTRVESNVPVLDLTELQTWVDIGWMKLGEVQLGVGSHKIEIRLPKTKDDKDKARKITYASDALLITAGEFSPNGKWKPNQTGRDSQDEEATANIFTLPEPKARGERASVKLKGLWEIARHDDNAPGEVAAPIQDFPTKPHWKAISVPGDKNKLRPDLIFAHRVWYRTRVNVPQSQLGRSFYLYFPLNNLNTTVYVNGTYCGFNKNPLSGFNVDVTKGVKAGVNEVWVGIKDAYYGFSADPSRPEKLRSFFRYPLEWQNKGFMDLDYPVWNSFQSGILNTPQFVVAGGPVYVSDVFVKPSVANKSLAAEITLSNTGSAEVKGEIAWEAVNTKTGATEKTFTPQFFSITTGEEKIINLQGDWTNPKLWWPDQPNEYFLRTTIRVGDQSIDVHNTKFGFREWRREGIKFTLNGVVWHMWAEIGLASGSPEKWLADYRGKQQRTARSATAGMGGQTSHLWQGLEVHEMLDFYDMNGVVIRRNTTPLDGQTIGYAFTEKDELKKKAQGGSDIKLDLLKNWRDACVAHVRAERNHPSIQIWSVENEFTYINLINLLGNSSRMDEYEREIAKTGDAVMATDPTRSVMVDGGGALKLNTLPVHGDHYVYDEKQRSAYPDLAYEENTKGGGRGRWEWDKTRPRFIGEDYFATGINPADYAWIGGEETFQGKAQARNAVDTVAMMLQQGYRWGGYYAAWHMWLESSTGPNHYTYNAPRIVMVREWDWSFASGQKIKRNFGIFNDTQYPTPLSFTRSLQLNGKAVWTKTTTHSVAPGTNTKFVEEIPLPVVTTRQEAKLVLTLSADNKTIFTDSKNVSILPTPTFLVATPVIAKSVVKPASKPAVKPAKVAVGVPRIQTRVNRQVKPKGNVPTSQSIVVYDPTGTTTSFFKRAGVPFTPLSSLGNLPTTAKILVIGSGALNSAESTSSQLAAYASTGKRVIVLDQKNPLKFQALPTEMVATNVSGRIAFAEDLKHPVMHGLKQKDFTVWQNGRPLFYNAYEKPMSGARSLVQSGGRLQNTTLVEIPISNGLMLLSQFDLGGNLATNPVAGQLLLNMVRYANDYKLEFRPVAAVIQAGSPLAKVLDSSGLQYKNVSDPVTAIETAGIKLVIVEATPANLQKLAAQPAKIANFNKTGGYIVFHGLTSAGLADYNKIVGFDHMIRPMRRERVSLTTPRNPLTVGLSLGDVVMLSGERIFAWTADEFVASDIFSAVVDYDDVAPFGSFKNSFYLNMVNGMTNADGWKYIVNVDKKENTYELTLPKPQTITEFTWVGNANYNLTTKVGLRFDGKDTVPFVTQPNNEPQTFAVNPPRSGKVIDILNMEFTDLPDKRGVIGVDNVYLKAQRPAGFYDRVKPMLNIGGLMQYPRGEGGFVLANLLFKDTETVPVNAQKKRTILTTILRNLKAQFAAGKTVIAGANLEYTSLDISKHANQYRNERGWFGDPRFTFADLATGKQTYGGVLYDIYDFPTSPVPTAVMLKGNGVPNGITVEAVRGIPVGRKADALFFLQAARIDRRRDERDLRENKKLEMARYVVTYADGQKHVVPIYSEIDVEDWKQKGDPKAIAGAQIAWVRPFPNTEFSAVAYSKQWNNPRPDVEIATVDLEYGADRRGVPVLLALTAANGR